MLLGYMEAERQPTTIAAKTLMDTKLCLNGKCVYRPWSLCIIVIYIQYILIMYYLILASQAWLLGRLVPFSVGEQVPEEDRHWQNYLLLLQILDLLLAPEITVDEVAHLSTLIPEHHSEFVNIYPDSFVISMLHYRIHTPRLILKLVQKFIYMYKQV